MFRMREETVVAVARTEVRLGLQRRDTRTLSAPESIQYSQENAGSVLYPLDLLLMVAFTKELRGERFIQFVFHPGFFVYRSTSADWHTRSFYKSCLAYLEALWVLHDAYVCVPVFVSLQLLNQ
jgi:hypothetical protein